MKIILLLLSMFVFLISDAQVNYPRFLPASNSTKSIKKLKQEIVTLLYEIEKSKIQMNIYSLKKEIERINIEKKKINIEMRELEMSQRRKLKLRKSLWLRFPQ